MKHIMNQESLSINNLHKIIEKNDSKVISLIQKHCKELNNVTDSRSILLLYLHEHNLSTLILYCNYEESYKNVHNKDWWINKMPHLKEVVEKPNFESFANDRDSYTLDFIKDYYILNYYFVFESKIRNIVRQLGDVPNLDKNSKCVNLLGFESWYWIYTGFFKHYLSLNEENIEVVKFFTAIRNTIHNGGFYFNQNGNENLKFMTQTYSFENSKPIDFLTWELKQNICNKLLELIDLTYSNPKIQSIRIIEDTVANVEFAKN